MLEDADIDYELKLTGNYSFPHDASPLSRFSLKLPCCDHLSMFVDPHLYGIEKSI